jgi:hypothetical protein
MERCTLVFQEANLSCCFTQRRQFTDTGDLPLAPAIHSLDGEEAVDKFSRSVPVDDVEYLVKNGEPRSIEGRPGLQMVHYNVPNLDPRNRQRLLQASRVSKPLYH